MRGLLVGALASIIVFAIAAEVFADPIIIITVDRRFTNVVVIPSSQTVTRATDALVATATPPAEQGFGLSTAELASSYADPMHWFGTGAATVSRTTGPGIYQAASQFELDFTVNSPVSYTFDASFTASRSVPKGCCN